VLVRELAEAAREAVDDALLEAAQPVEVQLRLAEVHAPVLGEPDLLD
jgi:hypothetical protein